ncbi:E3 ubiquitin-protein ligase rnf213-alpha isoform X3 [Nematostella vectensis]|uniref:E3 ubiquitin-protein ligase rnf213-alpha isoform X3 n=1 Tax=Nematostella vectensis TaxID=45351 RepID=UPI002076E694|nr:E3 ubiquitin-protein ligase rnf213-alpha isoform X3 [Nematostella vectensis]
MKCPNPNCDPPEFVKSLFEAGVELHFCPACGVPLKDQCSKSETELTNASTTVSPNDQLPPKQTTEARHSPGPDSPIPSQSTQSSHVTVHVTVTKTAELQSPTPITPALLGVSSHGYNNSSLHPLSPESQHLAEIGQSSAEVLPCTRNNEAQRLKEGSLKGEALASHDHVVADKQGPKAFVHEKIQENQGEVYQKVPTEHDEEPYKELEKETTCVSVSKSSEKEKRFAAPKIQESEKLLVQSHQAVMLGREIKTPPGYHVGNKEYTLTSGNLQENTPDLRNDQESTKFPNSEQEIIESSGKQGDTTFPKHEQEIKESSGKKENTAFPKHEQEITESSDKQENTAFPKYGQEITESSGNKQEKNTSPRHDQENVPQSLTNKTLSLELENNTSPGQKPDNTILENHQKKSSIPLQDNQKDSEVVKATATGDASHSHEKSNQVSPDTALADVKSDVNIQLEDGESGASSKKGMTKHEKKKVKQAQKKRENQEAKRQKNAAKIKAKHEKGASNEEQKASNLQQNFVEDQKMEDKEVSKENATIPPPPPRDFDEDCLTVVFHAILSPKFPFDPKKDSVHLRFGPQELGSFKYNSVDVSVLRCGHKDLLRLHGEARLPVRFFVPPSRSFSYKYIVATCDKKDINFEHLEFEAYAGEIIDRELVPRKSSIKKDGIWHQYDGFVYPPSKTSFREWLSSFFKNTDEFVKDRECAAVEFLPKWKGFVAAGMEQDKVEDITLSQALDQILMNKDCMSLVFTNSGHGRQDRRPKLDFDKVLREFLTRKIHSNACNTTGSKVERVDRLVSSLGIACTARRHNVKFDKATLSKLVLCLRVLPDGQGGCDFDDIEKDTPKEMWGELVEAVLYISNCVHELLIQPSMILLMVPVIHLLRGDCTPFKELSPSLLESKEKWCFSSKIPEVIWRPFDLYVGEIKEMFPVDPLLRRLFLCSITIIEDLAVISSDEAFPVHEVCTVLADCLKRCRHIYSNIPQIHASLENLSSRVISSMNDITAEVTARSAHLLLVAVLEKQSFNVPASGEPVLYLTAIKLFASCIKTMNKTSKSSEGKNGHRQLMDEAVKAIKDTIEKEYYKKIEPYLGKQKVEIKTWSKLIAVASMDEEDKRYWDDSLLAIFISRVKQLSDDKIIELFGDQLPDDVTPVIVGAVTFELFEAIKRIVEKGRGGKMSFELLQRSSEGRQRTKVRELLSHMLEDAWRKATNGKSKVIEYDFLHHLFTWKSWEGFLDFYGAAASREMWSDEACRIMERAISSIGRVQECIFDGSITVKTLKLVQQHSDDFIQLYCLVSKNDDKLPSAGSVKDNLRQRTTELAIFDELRKEISTYIKLCSSGKEKETFELKSLKAKTSEDILERSMSDLFTYPETSTTPSKNIFLEFFGLSPNFLEMLPLLTVAFESQLFQVFWDKHCKKATSQKREKNEMLSGRLTLEDVYGHVWSPSYSEWQSTGQGLLDGSTTLRQIDKLFKGRLKDDVERELRILFTNVTGRSDNDSLVGKRLTQIGQYFSLQDYARAADTVWRFKDAVGLTGDFSVLDDLRNQTSSEFKSKRLESIDDRLTSATGSLEKISPERSSCFQAIADCEALVKWLKETIRDTSALSTLVDLAMISAGENDMEVDRIFHFHTSCLSFAPLIFNLSKECGFEGLMMICEPVWKAVQQDKELPNKLRETNRHLEWLKGVKNSHGSVEMSSIMLAKTINQGGVYSVGFLDTGVDFNRNQVPLSEGQTTLDQVINLTVPVDYVSRNAREEDESEKKTMYLNDLKDLQSKLMLIAGKTAQLQNKEIESAEEINAFVEVFEGIMRLGKVYIALCEAGNARFLGWRQNFDCHDNYLTGQSIRNKLDCLCKEMEDELEVWREYMNRKRTKYHEFSHFTTRQIFIMREKIGAVRREGEGAKGLPLHVLCLLESVLPGISSKLLNEALIECFGINAVSNLGVHQHELRSSDQLNASFRHASVREQYASFFEKVESMSFDDPERVAVACLKASGTLKCNDVLEVDLLDWCFKHGDDDEIIDIWTDEAKQDRAFAEFFDDEEMDNGQEATEVQDSELEEQPCEHEEEDFQEDTKEGLYLTLDELGTLLRALTIRSEITPTARPFPEYLKRDQPNLLLVPQAEILPTVLTLYMGDGNSPLPSAAEVLACTPDTTAEEVELFWWRAFGDNQEQMFCLLNADLLPYNVSQAAVKNLSHMLENLHREDLKLVIICSTENEDCSHLIAALDAHRMKATPGCASRARLTQYFTKQFTCREAQHGYYNDQMVSWTPAATLDNDNLCVRVVTSERAGVGKSLVVSRLSDKLAKLENNKKMAKELKGRQQFVLTVPLHGTAVDTSSLLDALWKSPVAGELPISRIIHLDVSPFVVEGLDTVLFNLLVLGVMSDRQGRVWRRRKTDLYVIEVTTASSSNKLPGSQPTAVMFSLLPAITCITPRETLKILKSESPNGSSPLFDAIELSSEPVKRAYQYLNGRDKNMNLDHFKFSATRCSPPADCLALLIKYCGILNPSWSELRHFVDFLSCQLQDCEGSVYCDPAIVGDSWMQNTLSGFKTFVVQFMIHMSRDFATPSLDDAVTCTVGASGAEEEDEDIRPLQIRRRWENSPHPYIFFNQDRVTMTFMGFHINKDGDLIDPDRLTVLQNSLMSRQLKTGLDAQKVDFAPKYKAWSKEMKIRKLCDVMGITWREGMLDPDPNYELTIDNMKKILAIHMRFRCGIPVVIMGETGCGKTRLIRYMCALQACHSSGEARQNMLLMKVHGGTSYEDISRKVEQAEKMARENETLGVDTVLFFDEANTTHALGLIKEVMVDKRVNGRPVGEEIRRLHFIAACNPYRKHTDQMIHQLESAGLGYHVTSQETKEKLGKIPLRHLVYRVHALPASMRPLVWDFGQLKPEIEEMYIRQIVKRYIGSHPLVDAISKVLAASQQYMRDQKDECSFVSLRDIERAMTVMLWFCRHHQALRPQREPQKDDDDDDEDDSDDDDDDSDQSESDSDTDDEDDEDEMDLNTWLLVMSLCVCYHAKLQSRKPYRCHVVRNCSVPLNLKGERQMDKAIRKCQRVMIRELSLGPNIARNKALTENVFMMVVCIDLRIPLFLVGKPGSSKSLAKTVVADNMQGESSRSSLFKNFKRAHMVSYQCSPLSTPDGIVATFRQCRRLQENNPGGQFASVVVLDEVGLAEDSPLMPLKTLHPLLEDGVTSSDDVIDADETPTRVAFVGISNWSLDPAKMNRGLMLLRDEPSEEELVDSARGICAEDPTVQRLIDPLLEDLAAGYSTLYRHQKGFKSLLESKRDEFFGLRDFYSLVKMIYKMAEQSRAEPSWNDIKHAILRNFGGLDEIDAVKIFQEQLRNSVLDITTDEASPVNPIDLIKASLDRRNAIGETRYLLVLTENYSALPIVESELKDEEYVVIFGSSFPKDQEYTQICRNINQIKVCMETGRTVILLNLESLYESLYDALNQYYVYCADQKYVDLGLGSHRVKCRVDDTFRLIVIAEKDVVYEKFPIPLINRLEKHYLVTSKSLSAKQTALATRLKAWVEDFATVQYQRHEQNKLTFKVGDVFVGFHDDTVASVVLQMCTKLGDEDACAQSEDEDNAVANAVLDRCKSVLLQCATPDALARLFRTNLRNEADKLWLEYFSEQPHTCLSKLLAHLMASGPDVTSSNGMLVQVSTHSRLLSEYDLPAVCDAVQLKRRDVEYLTLQQFQTEQQFSKRIREFFVHLGNYEGMLIVQCDSGDENFNLIACARHVVMDQRFKRTEMLQEKLKIAPDKIAPLHLVIVAQLSRVSGGCKHFVGFPGGKWQSYHVDDLRPPTNEIPPIERLIDTCISDLLRPDVSQQDDGVPMETDETTQALTVTSPEEAKASNLGELPMETDETKEPLSVSSVEISMETDVAEQITATTSPQAVAMVTPNKTTSPQMQTPSQPKCVNSQAVALLRRSVHAAAGRLDDSHVMSSRGTHRVEIMLRLLPDDFAECSPDSLMFARALNEKIYKLVLERETKRQAHFAKTWMQRVALSGTNMHERGTFRKALQHRVSSEVVPYLSKVLAYADRDCNLDLLVDSEAWIKRLWLAIFGNEHVSELYCDVSTISYSGTAREPVPVSGRGGHHFRCRFPFSWLIRDFVEDLERGTSDSSASQWTRSDTTEEERLRRLIDSTELGYVIADFRREGMERKAIARYLHDLVHMVYRPSTDQHDQEIQIVCNAIEKQARIREAEAETLDLATVHVAYRHIQRRLDNLSELLHIQPGVLRNLQRADEGAEMMLDAVALQTCLEGLVPSVQDLQDHDGVSRWCARVTCLRQTVETMTSKENFDKTDEKSGGYGERTQNIIKHCWSLWQRASIVRLFVEHVTSPDDHAVNSANLQKLWKILGDETDMMANEALEALERFLKDCSQEFCHRHNWAEELTCPICLRECRVPSSTPCHHLTCLECARRWFNEQSGCPVCRQHVPDGYEPAEDQERMEILALVKGFRHSCNSFFMDVVSMFCFGYSPCGTLQQGAFQTLMGYATSERSTKSFSPFPDYGIDINPVVRSFLLQQLLKSSDTKAKELLAEFVSSAEERVGLENVMEVFVLCIQCIEDARYSDFVRRTAEFPLENKISLTERALRQMPVKPFSEPAPGHPNVNVPILQAIAVTRLTLTKTAEFIHQRHTCGTREWETAGVVNALNGLLKEVKKVCMNGVYQTPRLFLLKQLANRFGVDALKELASTGGLGWILPPRDTAAPREATPDRFLVYGHNYQGLREAIARAAVSSHVTEVAQSLQGLVTQGDPFTEVMMSLALLQAVTADQQRISPNSMQVLNDFILASRQIREQPRRLALELVSDVTQESHSVVSLMVMSGSTPRDRSIAEIVLHLAAVLSAHDEQTLAHPLVALARNPIAMARSFLPTMPEDIIPEVRSAFSGTGQLYECPNGHPYVITECGRPTQQLNCTECRAPIGGISHNLVAGNRPAQTGDRTNTGHCIGAATNRSVAPERGLSSVAVSFVRLLVHGSMLIGSFQDAQHVAQMITPYVTPNAVQQFLWNHVANDLRLLTQSSGRSVDDAILSVHLLIRNIATHAQMNAGNYGMLKSKQARAQWEQQFNQVVLAPTLVNVNESIQQSLQLIANDTRFGMHLSFTGGSDPLLRQLYELDAGAEDLTQGINPGCTALWRHRNPVSLDHMTRAFNESQTDQYPVLKAFLEQESVLRAIRLLPDVLRLQRLLMERFHRTLDRGRTDKLKLKEFYKQIRPGTAKEYRKLVPSFRSAWKIFKESENIPGASEAERRLLETDVGDDCPVALFLPSNSGPGTCSLVLVRFLVHTHNELLQLYNRSADIHSSDVPHVPLAKVREAHLVSYNPDRDLLPLVLGQCRYSFEVAQGAHVTYDWVGMERQVIDRFIRGRALIDFKEDRYIQMSTVSADSVLTSLRDKIPQESLSLAIQHQIASSYRSLQDLTEALTSLTIAITFLGSGGGKPDMPVSGFMRDVLSMPSDLGLRNRKAEEVCQLQHVVSLWFLLNIERAKHLMASGQDPFEHLPNKFKDKLRSDTDELRLNEELRKLDEANIYSLLTTLLEIIILRLDQSDKFNHESSLQDVMPWILEDRSTPEIKNIPQNVQLKHIVHLWRTVVRLSDSNHERRRRGTT